MLSKTEGNSPTLCISRGRVYAHMRACADKQEEACTHKGIAAAHRKKQVDEPFPTRRNNRNTVKLIRNQGHFFQGTERKAWKNPFLPPPKKSRIFRICSPGTVSFMSSKEQKFSRNRRFLPTGGQEFPENGQFCTSRKTKKWTRRPFFLARLGNPDQNSSPERQKIRKKFPEKLETELHVHKQNRNFSMQHGKWRHGNPLPQGHFYTGRPAFFMFPCRKTYVLPGGNLRFQAGKPTVYTPET